KQKPLSLTKITSFHSGKHGWCRKQAMNKLTKEILCASSLTEWAYIGQKPPPKNLKIKLKFWICAQFLLLTKTRCLLLQKNTAKLWYSPKNLYLTASRKAWQHASAKIVFSI